MLTPIASEQYSCVAQDMFERNPPSYFKQVQNEAQQLCEQLTNPKLSGPWWALFEQVQSPRHVLSELLQNADDAGATFAKARVEDDVFIFEHDGEDFNGEQFSSLCNFCFSNKRKLHTIGFRGIGFKSTFSLGSTVEVLTPSLAVKFEEKRFIEPVWLPEAPIVELTCIRVRIEDENRKQELLKNLEEWSNSPISILFFSNIRKLTIFDKTVEFEKISDGPAANTELIQLTGTETQCVLLARSNEEPFPEEAVEEIRKARGINSEKGYSLPPCRVELVIGAKGSQRFFVILPDIQHSLPFSCNAPFIQTPDRKSIKSPSESPTNRWLLDRIGHFAADVMLGWLVNKKLNLTDRCKGYNMIPKKPISSYTVADACEKLVTEAFCKSVEYKEILISTFGECITSERCLAPPIELYDVWSPEQIIQVFNLPDHVVLASEVSSKYRPRLVSWKWLNVKSAEETFSSLENENPVPKPEYWNSLLRLWEFVQRKIPPGNLGRKKNLKIIPVEGSDHLVSAESTVRIRSSKGNLPEGDWNFITSHLKVLDRIFLSYLSQLEKDHDKEGPGNKDLEIAKQFLKELGLETPSPVDALIRQRYNALDFSKNRMRDLIRFTHILAALDVAVPFGFKYINRYEEYCSIEDGLSLDINGGLEQIIPMDYANNHILHESYSAGISSCTPQQWVKWTNSEKSGLRSFIGFVKEDDYKYNRKELKAFVEERYGSTPRYFELEREYYLIEDYYFDPKLSSYWEKLASSDKNVWIRVLGLILEDPAKSWTKNFSMKISELGNKYEYPLNCGQALPAWVMQLRVLPCLEDNRGFPKEPHELLLRTPLTEPLLGIEPFVKAEIDTPENRSLLKILGARDTPAGIDKIIERLQILAKVDAPPIYELVKLYSRIDQILPRCSAEKLSNARELFKTKYLIFTSNGDWVTSNEVFQYSDEEEIPGVSVVHPDVKNFDMWRRLGVMERPNIEVLIEWLKWIKTGKHLEGQQLKRVRTVLQSAPVQVWKECSHWLSLDGKWLPSSDFKYRLSMQGLFKWGDMFPSTKEKTANLQMLSAEIGTHPPFSSLKELEQAIEYRITEKQQDLPAQLKKNWLSALARELQRVTLDDEDLTMQVRSEAKRLSKSIWQPFNNLKVTPYIENTPAGQPYEPDVIWHQTTLYVRDVPPAKIFNKISEELAKPFVENQSRDANKIRDAIKACMERDSSFIEEYVQSNFELDYTILVDDYLEDKVQEDSPEEYNISEICDETPESIIETEESVGTNDENPNLIENGNIDTEGDPAPKLEEEIEPSGDPSKDECPDTGYSNDSSPEEKTRVTYNNYHREPTLISLFAKANGFSWNETRGRYVHSDGSWIQKCEAPFNWERYDNKGRILCRYWVSDQRINSGIEIGADLWEMVKNESLTSALILRSESGKPIEIYGIRLKEKIDTGEMEVYPAKYRLRRKIEL